MAVIRQCVRRGRPYGSDGEDIENGTWGENEDRQEALSECDTLYFERPKNIEENLFAFITSNRAKIEP